MNYKKIIKKNSFLNFVKSVKNVPIQQYDLIINDFEPITAYAAKFRNNKIIGLSHQAAVLHEFAPKPEDNHLFSKLIFKKYAPIKDAYGFHFTKYDQNIYHPIFRECIKQMNCTTEDFFMVYLPSFNNETLYKTLSLIKSVDWVIFSPFSKTSKKQSNCTFFPIDERLFTSYLATTKGVLCGAGFEFPAEVLYLKKMLYVIPIKGQFEQYCNFLALKQIGVNGSEDLNIEKITTWTMGHHITDITFTDETEKLISKIMSL